MGSGLTISAEWERLDEGAAEERACFAAIGIWRNDISLTAGHDSFVNVVRKTPYLSGYHLAEWITWNWWRLRWEPRTTASDWAFAHRLSTIGGGYVWPDITIFSDGERTALVPRRTAERPTTAYRYIGDAVAVFPSREYEAAVDRFIASIRGRLRAEGVAETNLDVLWRDLTKERQDPAIAQRRTFEALLGREPDAADDEILRQLETDSRELGQSASHELAAHHDSQPEVLRAETLRQQAACHGFDIDVGDSYRGRPAGGPGGHHRELVAGRCSVVGHRRGYRHWPGRLGCSQAAAPRIGETSRRNRLTPGTSPRAVPTTSARPSPTPRRSARSGRCRTARPADGGDSRIAGPAVSEPRGALAALSGHVVPLTEQPPGDVVADEAGRAGHQDLHGPSIVSAEERRQGSAPRRGRPS